MRRLIQLAVLGAIAGCGHSATAPRSVTTPGAAPEPVGAVPVPADDSDMAEPVPAELLNAPLYPDTTYAVLARTDLSSLGNLELDVPTDFEDGDLRLSIFTAGPTQLTLLLDGRTYSRPEALPASTITSHGDAALFVVRYTDNDYGPQELALFRIGDEIREAIRYTIRPDAWTVYRVIRIAHGAEVRVVQPDPH